MLATRLHEAHPTRYSTCVRSTDPAVERELCPGSRIPLDVQLYLDSYRRRPAEDLLADLASAFAPVHPGDEFKSTHRRGSGSRVISSLSARSLLQIVRDHCPFFAVMARPRFAGVGGTRHSSLFF